MMKIIGIKRLAILTMLIVVNILLAAGMYMYLLPEDKRSERKLRAVRGVVSTLQFDIDRMQIEFEQLDQQRDDFDKLKNNGFFTVQTRSTARKILNEIQEEAGVIAAIANVKSGVIEESKEAQKANHKILSSPIEITVKAFDDADIYRYISISQRVFPGHLSIDGIVIKRSQDVSAPVLRAIATGANPELVSADIKMSWRTIIPESQVISGSGRGRNR